VIATGPGATNRDGKVIPVNVKVGDKVLLPEYGGHTLKGDKEEELLLLRDEDILAVIQE
jgi:chaperonin GroES